MKNEGAFERWIQVTISLVAFLGAFFWTSGVWQITLFVFATLVGIFSIVGFCPLYAIIGRNASCSTEKIGRNKIAALVVYGFILATAGAYASMFFTKKIFLEDFNVMNTNYKETLFETGQAHRSQSQENYDKLVVSFGTFENKYGVYRPYVLHGDAVFSDDLKTIEGIIAGVQKDVKDGDLKAAHLELEKVRPITQNMLKRNGFSMLSISLVDFHDSMEKVLDKADKKDAEGVVVAYVEANDKLNAIETEAHDDEIKAIRKNLEDILRLAKSNDADSLPTKAAELKSSFVRVYLKRG